MASFWNILLVDASQKSPFLALRKWKMIFFAKKLKNFFGIIVCHVKMHVCTKYGHIISNYAMDVAITLVICFGSHETSYMIARFWEHLFKIFAIFQVFYFPYELGHIKWHNAKILHFFELFWISYAWFKTRSKRRAWPFLGRCGILQNY